MKSNQSSGHPPCTCYLWILGKSLILWIGRLCGGFFIIYGIRDKILKVQYQGFTCQVEKSSILWIGMLCGGYVAMWRLLHHYGIRDKILKLQYQGFTCQVLHRGTTTKPIKVKTGVRQRCLLLLLLFLMVLDWVLKNAYEGKRLGLGLGLC